MPFWGKKDKNKPSSKAAGKLQKSVDKMQDTVERMDKHEAYLKRQVEVAQFRARELMQKGDKRGAAFELKKKAKYQRDLESMWGKRSNIESQTMAINSAFTNVEMLDAMKKGQKALSSVVNERSVEEVADLFDEIQESMAFVEEIDTTVSVPTLDSFLDVNDVDEELAELENEYEHEKQMNAMAYPRVEHNNQAYVPASKAQAHPRREYELEPEDEEALRLSLNS